MAWVAPAVGAASGLFGLYDANKQRKQQNKDAAFQRGLITENRAAAKPLGAYGSYFLDQSKAALNPLMNFYTRAFRGDAPTLMSLYGRDIANVGEGYDQATRNVANFAPRGGTGALAAANLPFQRARDINAILLGARPQAAQILGNLGAQTGAMGSSLMGTYLGGLTGSANQNQSLMQQMLLARKQLGQEGEAAGSALINAILGFQKKGPYYTG